MKNKRPQSALEIRESSKRPLTGDFWAAVALAIYAGAVSYAYGQEPPAVGSVCERAGKFWQETRPVPVVEFIAGKDFDGFIKVGGIPKIAVGDIWDDPEGRNWEHDFFYIKKMNENVYLLIRQNADGDSDDAVIFVDEQNKTYSLCSYSGGSSEAYAQKNHELKPEPLS